MNANALIDALGGTCAVARRFHIASSSVAIWRHNGIPKARMQTLLALALTQRDVAAALEQAGVPVPKGRGKQPF